MEAWKKFVLDLTRVKAIQQAEEKAIEEWGDDIPTTLLFAKLGKAIIANFDGLSEEDRIYAFDVIEQGIKSSDTILSTAVATGLLEAVSGQISKDSDLEKKVNTKLGEISKKYLTDWENWQNSR
jgi:hypothetical protein